MERGKEQQAGRLAGRHFASNATAYVPADWQEMSEDELVRRYWRGIVDDSDLAVALYMSHVDVFDAHYPKLKGKGRPDEDDGGKLAA